MQTIPIVFCFDKRILLGAGVAIKSLIDSAKPTTSYDIRIFHSDISEKKQQVFFSLIENTQHKMKFHEIDGTRFSKLPCNSGSWRRNVYYRFLIPEILSEYNKAIYSDVDVFFKKDMSDIFQQDISDYQLAAVRAECNRKGEMICHRYFEENKKDFVFWSGFFIINCKRFRDENLIEKFFELGVSLEKKLSFFDLDLMNAVCQNIKPVPFEYVSLEAVYEFSDITKVEDYAYLKNVYSDAELLKAKVEPAIIHYAGQLGKPWHRKKFPSYYEDVVKALPKALRTYTFRDLRKRFFSKI